MPDQSPSDIVIALTKLEGKVEAGFTSVQSTVASLDSRLSHMEHNVVGNGKVGLLTRMDRVEQDRENEKKQWLDVRKNLPLIAIVVLATFGGEAGTKIAGRLLGWNQDPPTQQGDGEEEAVDQPD